MGDCRQAVPFAVAQEKEEKMKELELYIHIPFCIQKCRYCDFLSGPADDASKYRYTKALIREIESLPEGRESIITTVFFGGGTPSVLPGEWTARILETLKKRFSFAADAEITTEANPGTVDKEKLRIWRESGINRISFGCQSSFHEELQMLGRIHTWEDFLESYALARESGFDNINIDLMSGLPGQKLKTWETTLHRAAELKPEHISAYSLIVEEGTPFASMNLDLPDEDTERMMYSRTREILAGYGYGRYEISNYALQGRECRHNIGYWIRTPYIGLGLGASSCSEVPALPIQRIWRNISGTVPIPAVCAEILSTWRKRMKSKRRCFWGCVLPAASISAGLRRHSAKRSVKYTPRCSINISISDS